MKYGYLRNNRIHRNSWNRNPTTQTKIVLLQANLDFRGTYVGRSPMIDRYEKVGKIEKGRKTGTDFKAYI